MSVREITHWTDGTWTIEVQHPAVRLTMHRIDDRLKEQLPTGGGCYIHIATALQRLYVGTSEHLSGRVPSSLTANLPSASHVLTIEPLGVSWSTEQRHALEGLLISTLPGTVNRNSGRGGPADTYLLGVVHEVRTLLGLQLFTAVQRPHASQGRIAVSLVLGEHQHPFSVGELIERLRDLGWTATGHTVHRTLRRDLKHIARGGHTDIEVDGPWSDPHTHVYVRGRRYTSGWRHDQT